MTEVKPPLHAQLLWDQDLRFGATVGTSAIVVDGNSVAGPSPVQLVAIGLAGCMAIDVVDILKKGRHPLTGLRVAMTGERAPDPPRRITKAHLHFVVHGDVPVAAVERAIALSREKYCSVWHTLRQDIALTTEYEIVPQTVIDE